MVAGIPISPTPTRGSAHDVSDSGSSDVSTTSEEESSVEESGDDDDDYLKDPDARGSNDPPPRTAGHPSKGASKETASVGVPVEGPGVSGVRGHGSASTGSVSPRTSPSIMFSKHCKSVFLGTWM